MLTRMSLSGESNHYNYKQPGQIDAPFARLSSPEKIFLEVGSFKFLRRKRLKDISNNLCLLPTTFCFPLFTRNLNRNRRPLFFAATDVNCTTVIAYDLIDNRKTET